MNLRRWLIACVIPVAFSAARGEFPTSRPFAAVEYAREQRAEPRLEIFLVTVDLSDADVSVQVAPGGPDPDGPAGQWQTTLDETADIAAREGFDIAVNGDFFSVETVIDPQTGKKRGYHEGQSALVIGPAMTNGRHWAQSGQPRSCLIITRDGRAIIGESGKLPADARQVIAGSDLLLRDGSKVINNRTPFATTRHPRTAVGTAENGRRLILLVVDGRRPDRSVGMSLDELAEFMLARGCENALNLDGGGSSTLVMRNPDTGDLRVMNHPSDGKQRPVANVLGVRLRANAATAATTRPSP